MMTIYTEQFYRALQEGSRRSAREIIPLVLELTRATSVVDVGCGLGDWLAVFREHGVEDIWGIDGQSVDRRMLEIPDDRFAVVDLACKFRLGRTFDLALSLEVAEHLPRQSAGAFVESLTSLAPVVLFSAAIPFQGGTGHVNEQWPDYWIGHFERNGFVVIDCLRRRIWRNEGVDWWYAQNILMFAHREYVDGHPELARELQAASPPLSVVHPRKYAELVQWIQQLDATGRGLASLVPQGETCILVDDEQFRALLGLPVRLVPFLARDGIASGRPPDGVTAVAELQRLHREGATFIAFARPAFWWLDHYAELRQSLRSQFSCVLKNDHLIVFHLGAWAAPSDS